MDARLVVLQHFFEVDNRIKKEMYDLMPPTDDLYLDNASLCKYSDKLGESIQYIFSELKCCTMDLFGDNSLIFKKIIDMENNIKRNYYNCGLDINKLRNFYKVCFTFMDEKFIDEVKANCVGYYEYKNLPINTATSINEILHLIHSYVLNDEQILQSIPEINKKYNNDNYPISYRGLRVGAFEDIFMSFPIDLDVGFTDIICLSEKKALMMVRDVGHALTIEVTLSNDMARLEYFIPKICSVDKVNRLPGINKINNNSVGATGVIVTDINKLSETINDFISKVPTDLDILNEKFNISKSI